MKYLINCIVIIAILSGCKRLPITKVELPSKGEPPHIEYSKVILASGNKTANYENVMKKFMEMCPKSKILNDDTSNCYFLIRGQSLFNYRGHEERLRYRLAFQGTAEDCSITINQIAILKGKLEAYYSRNSYRNNKKFNPSYEDINNKLNAVMEELEKQVK